MRESWRPDPASPHLLPRRNDSRSAIDAWTLQARSSQQPLTPGASLIAFRARIIPFGTPSRHAKRPGPLQSSRGRDHANRRCDQCGLTGVRLFQRAAASSSVFAGSFRPIPPTLAEHDEHSTWTHSRSGLPRSLRSGVVQCASRALPPQKGHGSKSEGFAVVSLIVRVPRFDIAGQLAFSPDCLHGGVPQHVLAAQVPDPRHQPRLDP